VHGFAPSLTSFVGRTAEAGEIAGLLGEFRLVTVTGPGGVGKTRLADEVACQMATGFADGAWLVELAGVQEPDLVPAAVAAALGVPQAPGRSVLESLTGVLARLQMLVVLDNCEHVAGAAAELCEGLLLAADDVRVLATSRVPVGVAGEARYRLPPLSLPAGADGGMSEAVVLFADRARQVDPHFALTAESGPVVARLVEGLDGMPLAIELAAARVESLGVSQLLDCLDDRFALLAGGGRAAARHRSLAAAVEWSYQLLGEDEQLVFRRLAVFPGPFTLEAADVVAGADAGPVVLRLVDCSLLAPPRAGPDGRTRYLMLETLRAYGASRLDEAGEQSGAASSLAAYALTVAERAAAQMETSTGELAAAQLLDAEDATVHQSLAWALEHDLAIALRLAIAMAPWWERRGRAAAGYPLLRAAAARAEPGGDAWYAAQLWLGRAAGSTGDMAGSLSHFTACRDALAASAPSPLLADALVCRSQCLLFLGRLPEGAQDAQSALALSRELSYLAGEAKALRSLSLAAQYAGDAGNGVEWARQACRIDPAAIPGGSARQCVMALADALMGAGEVTAAQRTCADGLARARAAGDLYDQAFCLGVMMELDLEAGSLPEAGLHLRELAGLAARIGMRMFLADCLDVGGFLCAATGRGAEAVTLWAAYAAYQHEAGMIDVPQDIRRRQESLGEAAHALGPDRLRAAEERGTAMTLATAAEFAIMVSAAALPGQPDSRPSNPGPPGGGRLSARERELVTLVARGSTNAQIAAKLYISVRTVSSHLDRIRDKTGCRRRADLTRLALQAGLI
jgi:predicted ATPase/DNA-binding CsgD family transcriptional regulator